jgi:hypothetical protein
VAKSIPVRWTPVRAIASTLRTLLVLLLASACTIVRASPDRTAERREAALEASPWSQADGLFRQNPRWLGGDGASSILLGNDKTLWLFGDSFIAHRDGPADRRGSKLIHNSAAVQTGLDPATARLQFHWRSNGDGPAAFLPWNAPGEWLWPMHGLRLGDSVTIFAVRVRRADNPLGFDIAGWTALRALGVDRSPEAWDLRPLPVPTSPGSAFAGISVVHLSGWVFAYAAGNATPRDAFLMRWPEGVFLFGDLSQPEWWVGDRWLPHHALAGWPAPVLRDAASEFSVGPHPRGGFVLVEAHGFPVGNLAVRSAERLEGPWTDPVVVFRPPEGTAPKAMVYAGKAHPELLGGELVATYVASSLDFAAVVRDTALYYPRFVRLRLPP